MDNMKIEVTGDKVSLQIEGAFTSDELVDLLSKIGEARAQVAKDGDSPQEAGRVLLVTSFRYWTIPAQDQSGSMLFFRLPTTGWTGITLPHPEVARLIALLAAQLTIHACATTAVTIPGDDNAASSGGGGLVH
jgi:hypothetical protein